MAVALTLWAGLPTASAEEKKDDHPAKSLTAQASDPNAPIIQLSITNFYSPKVYNADGTYNLFEVQPVIPIPKLEHFPVKQILRPTVPVLKLPDGTSGMGDINMLHLFIPDLEDWGSWGLGYTFTFPTATDDELGSGKWQVGPAATATYYGIKNWQFGGIVSNTVSFAGDSSRADVNMFTFQPILNRIIGKWYLGIGDLVWTYNWENSGGWTIPMGLQLGRITKIGKHNYNISVEFGYTLAHENDVETPEWGFRLGFVFLIPEKLSTHD